MKSFFHNLFLLHWERKLISLILAIFIWWFVDHSQGSIKVLEGVAVRVAHLSPDYTIRGRLPTEHLEKRISLTLYGNQMFLEKIHATDVEIVIDGQGKTGEWTEAIGLKNLVCLNPEVDLAKFIHKVSANPLFIQIVKRVSDKIPVFLHPPVGTISEEYEFLSIWPEQLYVTVSGPEDIIKILKNRGVPLQFNVSQIPESELIALQADTVRFSVPPSWRNVWIPEISSSPIPIDDPQADRLKIDFLKTKLFALDRKLPLEILYSPGDKNREHKPHKLSFQGSCVEQEKDIFFLNSPLLIGGVSQLFFDLVKEYLTIHIYPHNSSFGFSFSWEIGINQQKMLENRYVALLMARQLQEEEHSYVMEQSLRNRFRKYCNQLTLYHRNQAELNLIIEKKEDLIEIREE